MTDKIEIPEEIKIRLQEKFIREDLRLSDAERFLYDLIQKQDNKIGVGDWYHTEIINNSNLYFYYCEDEGEAVRASTNSECKKAPKELIAGLEKLRNG